MSTDIVVDLETTDTLPTSSIVSIGACRIDWQKGQIVDDFYVVVDQESGFALGLTQSASTMRWWQTLPPEQRAALDEKGEPITEALLKFADYLRPFGLKNVQVWGNGSDFDNAILANAYNSCGFELPWPFWNNRCFRTMNSLYGRRYGKLGNNHNALDDARNQANRLLQINPYGR